MRRFLAAPPLLPLAVCSLAVVVALAAAATWLPAAARVDAEVVGLLHAHAVQPLTDWNLAVTVLGSNHVILLVTLAGVTALALARQCAVQWRSP